MNDLTWDDDLALVAQRWADQCSHPEVTPHDILRNSSGFPYVGQNRADSWSNVYARERDYRGMVQSWYDEVKDFPSYGVSPYSKQGAR